MEVVFLFAVKRKSDPQMHSFALLKTELLNPDYINNDSQYRMML